MKRIMILLSSTLLAVALVGCASNPVAPAESSTIQPAASAPVIPPADYVTSYADSDHYLLDVRENSEVARGVIPGANHIPLGQLEARISEIPAGATVVVYCNSGNRSRRAVNILNNAGHNQLLDLGGIMQWQGAGYDLVPLEN